MEFELIKNWACENIVFFFPENSLIKMIASGFLFFGGIYIMLKSFTYPFITKYGSILHSITRGGRNEKRKSGLFEFITGFTVMSVMVVPLIKFSFIICVIYSVFWILDSGRDRM